MTSYKFNKSFYEVAIYIRSPRKTLFWINIYGILNNIHHGHGNPGYEV